LIYLEKKRKKNNKILRKVNSKNKKNPRKILYGGKGTASSVRHFVEHSQPIPQCDHTINNYHEYVNPTCYICGEPWIEGTQSSMECEHILCVIHGIEYYGLLQSVYLSEDQKNFLSILYAWAHRCCNQRKRNIAFIRKNRNQSPEARGNYFVPDDVNIRELLSDIFTLSTYSADAKYSDGTFKSKFDCSQILKKYKGNKKQFLDKRTAVVTSYVTPLVACVNTVFTGLFEANMVLFNAIGCLKIIAEMSIYFTATGKKAPILQLDLGKTASFMSEIVFPGCERSHGAAHGGGGRRIIQDKKTRKSLRRKIQRGGRPQEVIDAISELLAQDEYEAQMDDFKNGIDEIVEGSQNPSSIGSLSRMLNDMFPGMSPSPFDPPPSPPLPLGEGIAQIDTSKMNAILFILFVLNHSRNPTVLLGLFLDLKKQDSIVGEQTRRAVNKARADPDPESADDRDFQGNINTSFGRYQAKCQVNKTAFINICGHVFANGDTMSHISNFLTACDMMPSFIGVVMFFKLQIKIRNPGENIFPNLLIPEDILDFLKKQVTNRVKNVEPHLMMFRTNIDQFHAKLQSDENLFSGVVNPTTPLDLLVNACYHLKACLTKKGRVKTLDTMLLDACCLFPSCFDGEDIFSQFGPCAAFNDGVLEGPVITGNPLGFVHVY
jgi:hypothetical protein